MKLIALLLAGLFALLLAGVLAACGVKASDEPPPPPPPPETSEVVGGFTPSGGGYMQIRTFTVDGTKCIWVGRYSSSSLSCDWNSAR